MESTKQQRTEVLEFLEENVVSLSQEGMEDVVTFQSSRRSLSGYLMIITTRLWQLELTEISRLASEGDLSDASAKYLRLWTVVDNLFSGKGEIVRGLMTVSLADTLTEFYAERPADRLTVGKNDLVTIVGGVSRKIDTYFLDAIALDYLSDKHAANELLSEMGISHPIPKAWPWFEYYYFDYYKTLRTLHDLYHETASLIRKPRYSLEEGVFDSLEQGYEEISDEAFNERQGSWALGVALSNPSYMQNPVGGLFLTIPAIVRLDSVLAATTQLKARLLLLAYFAESLENNEFGSAPIDPFTGEAFVIKDTGDSYQVESKHIEFEIKRFKGLPGRG